MYIGLAWFSYVSLNFNEDKKENRRGEKKKEAEMCDSEPGCENENVVGVLNILGENVVNLLV